MGDDARAHWPPSPTLRHIVLLVVGAALTCRPARASGAAPTPESCACDPPHRHLHVFWHVVLVDPPASSDAKQLHRQFQLLGSSGLLEHAYVHVGLLRPANHTPPPAWEAIRAHPHVNVVADAHEGDECVTEGCCKTGRLRFGGVLHPSYIRLTSVLHPSYIRLTSVLHASYMRLTSVLENLRRGVLENLRRGVLDNLRRGVLENLRRGVLENLRRGVLENLRRGVLENLRRGVLDNLRRGVLDYLRRGLLH